MPGFRSNSDRDAGLRSGHAHGAAFNQARLGRADSHVAPHVGKGGLNRRADQGGPLPRPRPAAGMPHPQLGPESETR